GGGREFVGGRKVGRGGAELFPKAGAELRLQAGLPEGVAIGRGVVRALDVEQKGGAGEEGLGDGFEVFEFLGGGFDRAGEDLLVAEFVGATAEGRVEQGGRRGGGLNEDVGDDVQDDAADLEWGVAKTAFYGDVNDDLAQ